MIVAGVDEAGRGSVLGPLVVAGVAIEESKIPRLTELGVKDSKLLSPARRKQLFKEVKRVADGVTWEKIEPKRIDDAVLNGTRLLRLNHLEAEYMALVLSKLRYDFAYVDCCDTNQTRYGHLVADLLLEKSKRRRKSSVALGEKNPHREKIKSEHHADRLYPVVSAASIIAKVTRDAHIARLHTKHGAFGSGYPSDPATVAYLKGFLERSQKLPTITRLSWATIRRLIGEPRNPVMDDFRKV